MIVRWVTIFDRQVERFYETAKWVSEMIVSGLIAMESPGPEGTKVGQKSDRGGSVKDSV